MLTAKKGSMKLDFPYKAPERENKGDPGKNASRKSRPLGAKGFRGGNHNHEVSSTLSKESGPQGQRHLKEGIRTSRAMSVREESHDLEGRREMTDSRKGASSLEG